jgi:hypothetical protein
MPKDNKINKLANLKYLSIKDGNIIEIVEIAKNVNILIGNNNEYK